MQSILIVENDKNLLNKITAALARARYKTTIFRNRQTALRHVLRLRPDLVLLSLHCRPLKGITIREELRRRGLMVPIILIVSAEDDMDQMLIDTEADDYLVKPFDNRELLSRVRTALRRSTANPLRLLRFDNVSIDLGHRTVMRDGEEIQLTLAEYKLLAYFATHPGIVFSRAAILNSVWGYAAYPSTRTVDVHIARLRHKLELDPRQPRHFITVHRSGYRFVR
jgi:two-component system alkaline phosphatase synthesis response regulator PhoP